MKAKKSKHKKGSSALLMILLIISAGIFCFAAYRLAVIFYGYKAGNDEYKSIEANYTIANNSAQLYEESGSSPGGAQTGPAAPESRDPEPPLTVDWEQLSQINPDIVGWIYVEAFSDTISYPVLHGEDNEYYLKRTFEKKELFAGSIFENYENARDFTDPHTLIYGHNMKNGSMFAKTRKFADPAVLASDPYFWILTPQGSYRYQIFSVFDTDMDSDLYQVFSGRGQEFLSWAEQQKGHSSVKTEVGLTENDYIVTLSTCTAATGPGRSVVMGKCVSSIKPGETAQGESAADGNGTAQSENAADGNGTAQGENAAEPAGNGGSGSAEDADGTAQLYTAGEYTVDRLDFERDGMKIAGYVYRPAGKGPFPTVICCHGYAGNQTHMTRYAQILAENGYAAYTFDFIGGGEEIESDGTMAQMSVLTEAADLTVVFEGIRQQSWADPEYIYLLGESQGGYVVSYTAAELTDKVRGAILYFPAYEIREDALWMLEHRFGGVMPGEDYAEDGHIGRIYIEDALAIDIFACLPKFKEPVLMIHGTEDDVAPFEYALKASELFPDCEFYEREGTGHGFFGEDFSFACEKTLHFLQEHTP